MSRIADKLHWRYNNLLLHLLKLRNLAFPSEFQVYTVFGSGRSGTTWLTEMLADISGGKIIDEPLKRTNSHKIDKMRLVGWGQYMPEHEAGWNDLAEYFIRLYALREINPNHLHDMENLWRQNTWLIKFIRANLLMPWLVDFMELRKPVYIVRNPYSVIASQMKHPGWGLNREGKLTSKVEMSHFRYYDLFYKDFQGLYDRVETREEFLAFIWVLENKYILNHPKHGKAWISVKYEDIVLNPQQELKRICELLNINFTNKSLDLTRPSYSSNLQQIESTRQIDKWKSDLKASQIDAIHAILEAGGMHHYSEIR